MKRGVSLIVVDRFLSLLGGAMGSIARAGQWTPRRWPAFRAFWRRVPWQLLLLLMGFMVQAGLMFLIAQLVDLCISLFEAWVILARHRYGL